MAWFRRVAATAALVCLAALVGGCGHASSHKQPAASRGGSVLPQPSAPVDPQPRGRLSAAEYRTIEGEYARMAPVSNSSDLRRSARRARSICASIKRPNTRLIGLVKGDCSTALKLFATLGAFESAGSECINGSPDRERKCVADRLRAISIALQKSLAVGVALNVELRHRDIGGLCALSIGIRPQQIRSLGEASAAAQGAATALTLGDGEAFQRLEQRLTSALQDNSPDALVGIRKACRPGKSSATPKQPATPKQRSTPRPKRRAPLPHLDQPDGGISA